MSERFAASVLNTHVAVMALLLCQCVDGTSLAFAQAPAFDAQLEPKSPVKPPVKPPSAHDLSVQISEYVRCIFQDRDGRLWFGTNSDGVCWYDGKSLTFLQKKEGLGGHAVRKIVQTADGAMWFTTEGGVSRYRGGRVVNYTTADGLSSNATWSMMLDRAGTLWVGTEKGVCRYVKAGDSEPKAGMEKPFVPFAIPRAVVETNEARFDPRLVWSMFEDKAGNMWFGTDGEGVRKYDGKTFTAYTAKNGLGGNQVRTILGDRQGRIWIGGDQAGVTCFEGESVRTFREKDGLGNDRVYTLFEDKAGDLWISTLAAGVSRYDGKTFTAHRQLGGLARTHVQSIFEDRDGRLWFGCSGGLFRLDGKAFVNVTKAGPWR